MIHLPIYAAIAAALIMVLQTGLMMTVGFRRIKYEQGIGDGGHNDLLMLIRRHGNLTENAPLFVALLAFIEMVIGSTYVVAAMGGAFLLVRIAHAIGLTIGEGPNAFRFIGAFGTMLLCFGSAGYLLFNVSSLI